MPKKKSTKACDITSKVREEVYQRDKRCIFCGTTEQLTVAHYIPRSKLGLGIPQNLVIACIRHHHELDNTTKRKKHLEIVKKHLQQHYGYIEEDRLKYKKYQFMYNNKPNSI